MNNTTSTSIATRAFWRTRQFWLCTFLVIFTCMAVGYLVGNWAATNSANAVLAKQERAYKEAGDARKAVLEQCLTNYAQASGQLAALGNKATDATRAAADALQKFSNDAAEPK